MEILLIGLLILVTIQTLFVRYWLAIVSRKISKLQEKTDKIEINSRSIGNALNFKPTSNARDYPPASPNEIQDTNKNLFEFNEDTPFSIPKDIKFEVEGGDTAIPPGYNERAN